MLLSQKQGVLEFPKWLSALYLTVSFCGSVKADLEPTGKNYKKKEMLAQHKKATTESSIKGTAYPNIKLHPVPGINGMDGVIIYKRGQSGWQTDKHLSTTPRWHLHLPVFSQICF